MRFQRIVLWARRRWWVLALVVAGGFAALAAAFFLLRRPAPTNRPAFRGPIQITAPAEVPAGESVTITVSAPGAPEGSMATVVARGSYGPKVLTASVEQGSARAVLAGSDTQVSGVLSIIALVGEARAVATTTIQPGEPIEPITPLIGGRSIIADTKHWSMVVVVPFDRYGNPAAPGTPVEFRVRHPDNALQITKQQTANFLSWQRIWSGTVAGRTFVSVRVNDAHGPEGDLMEVAGWPVNMRVTASPARLPADGRQLVTLRSSKLYDRYGNSLPDGTQVSYVVEQGAQIARVIPATVVDGVAQTVLQAASEPGSMQVRLVVYGVESTPATVTFTAGPAVAPFQIDVIRDNEAGNISFRAGPLLGDLQQYVSDGTSVTFEIIDTADEARTITGSVVRGYATVTVRQSWFVAGRYQVRVTSGDARGSTTLLVRKGTW